MPEIQQLPVAEPPGFKQLYREPTTVLPKRTNAQLLEHEARFRYEHLPEEEQNVVEAILKGYQPLEALPKLKSRVVRIFISSTFTDMEQERNTLMIRAYPKLKAYCKERYGLEFQVVDMRWGVQTTARDDHSTNELCMEEIASSQLNSVGPNFVVFLGEKYGCVDIPARIEFETFEPIRTAIKEANDNDTVNFFDTWYKKDSNAVPTQYVLQPISSVFGKEDSGWPAVERRLHELLVDGATSCVKEKTIPEHYLKRLNASITEQELAAGVFSQVQASRDNNSLCFMRDIAGLTTHLDRAMVGNFIDLMPNTNEVDPIKHTSMRSLREHRVRPVFSKNNLFHYPVKWHDPTGVDKHKHDGYLDKLATTFYNRVSVMIDASVARQARRAKDALYEEVLQQWELARMRCRDFMGQDEALQAISDYILEDTDQPFIVHGESGFGKTSLMAKAASEVNEYIQQKSLNVLPAVVVRFCGTSPSSSNIRQLLDSLCHQLAFVSGKYRHQLPKDFKLIKAWFKEFLRQGDFPGIVVIFLDALNQLSAADSAHKLDWLPSKIACNVKVIVSTVPQESGILTKLKSKITNPQYAKEITQMSPGLCAEILNKNLSNRGRIINFAQWRLVRDVFTKCSNPLFMKLTFEESLSWKSYTVIPEDALATSVTACIHKLFDRLEEKHGSMMVSRALGYITASKEGISEAEMEDVMSIDDVLLNAVFVWWEPPIRRMPPMLFPRVHNDISGYLTEREVDQTTVMYWYHQQFIAAAKERYLSDPETVRDMHSNLSDFFLGTWCRMKKKSFVYKEFLAERLRLTNRHSAAVRYVPEQPLKYQNSFNFRKLNQLPFHLANAGRNDDLYEHVYFNYEWLATKLEACSVQGVIQDYNLVNDREVALVGDALRMSEAALGEDVGVLSVELTGRLLPHYSSLAHIRKLIVQCDTAAMKKCPIVPNWQVYTTPGGPLQYVCEATSATSAIDCDIIQSEDTVLLTAKPFHGTRMRIWDITQGEPQPDMTLPIGSQVYPTPDGVYINLFKNSKFLQTYRVDSGELYGEVMFGHGNIKQVEMSNRYVAFTFEQSVGPVVINIEASLLLHKFQYQARSVAVSKDERFLVTNNGRCLVFHSLPMLERKCVTEVEHAPEKLMFCTDSSKYYMMDAGHELKAVKVNLAQRKAHVAGILRDLEMKDFILSHSEKLLLVRASRCLYVITTLKDTLSHRIVNMPTGVFLERLSTFKDAGFTPNDEYIVAARHIYLGVWCARTGSPVRLLQTSISPIMKLFTSDIVNRAITLSQDQSIQVWNLDNLEADVQHLNALLRGKIQHMDSSSNGKRIICAGSVHAEARVLDLETNKCIHTLEHTEEVGKVLDGVVVSPCGTYAVTRFQNGDIPEYLKPWHLLKEDKLWNLADGERVFCLSSNRFVVFSPIDDKVVFFQCRSYSTYDWSIVAYDMVVYLTDGPHKGESFCIGLPEGNVVGEPLITGTGRYLCMVMQLKDKASTGTKSSAIGNKPKAGASDQTALVLVVYSFEKMWRGLKFLELSDIWNCFNEDDRLMDVRPFHENTVLVTYGKRTGLYQHRDDGVLDRSKLLHKGAFQYDVHRDNILTRYESLLSPSSRVDQLMQSRACAYIMDSAGQVFSTVDNEHVYTLDLKKSAAPQSGPVFILNGSYVAMLKENRRELLVLRTCDGVQKARVFIHGIAMHLQKAINDHTLVIGCQDGRVMTYSVILEVADPMRDIINLLPSRSMSHAAPQIVLNGDLEKTHGKENASLASRLSYNKAPNLNQDIRNIQTTQNMQKRLSTITRAEIAEQKRKTATFKTVGQAMALTLELKKVTNTSAACSIQ